MENPILHTTGIAYYFLFLLLRFYEDIIIL